MEPGAAVRGSRDACDTRGRGRAPVTLKGTVPAPTPASHLQCGSLASCVSVTLSCVCWGGRERDLEVEKVRTAWEQ